MGMKRREELCFSGHKALRHKGQLEYSMNTTNNEQLTVFQQLVFCIAFSSIQWMDHTHILFTMKIWKYEKGNYDQIVIVEVVEVITNRIIS